MSRIFNLQQEIVKIQKFMELIMNDFSYFDCRGGKSKNPPSPHPPKCAKHPSSGNLGILGSSGTSCTKPSVRAARTETWRHATPIRPFFHPPFWTVFPCQVTAGMIPPPKQQVFEENTAGLFAKEAKLTGQSELIQRFVCCMFWNDSSALLEICRRFYDHFMELCETMQMAHHTCNTNSRSASCHLLEPQK